MFSASCSPVKMSGSKQINAIFITIYISGTAISFEKMPLQTHNGALLPRVIWGRMGDFRRPLFTLLTLQTNQLTFRKMHYCEEIDISPPRPGNGVLSPFPTSFLHPRLDFLAS